MAVDLQTVQAKVIAASPKVLMALAILFAGYIAVKSSGRILKWIKETFAEKTATELDDMILDALRNPLRYIIIAITLILAAGQLGMDVKNIVTAILVLFLAKPVSNIVKIVMDKVEEDYVKKTKSKVDDVVFPLVNKTVNFLIYIFAVIMALDQLGIKVLPFVAGLGIVGLAIGLAAKDSIANVIAGIFIIIDRPFVVGDRIEAWSAPKQAATWGDVMEIGLRSTKIRTTDNILLIIPNSEISKRDIINYTAISPDIRVRVPVGIAYEADRKKAEELILDVAKGMEGVKEKPAPVVIMKGFGDSSIDLELRAWIDNARARKNIMSALAKGIKTEFDRQGIEIPYPKRHIIMEK
ncbi:MAG: mechanosensitive ion channel family protein [Candidatus Hydrothermarchaeaceae archaeon]